MAVIAERAAARREHEQQRRREAQEKSQSRQMLRPSYATRFSSARSTPSRQRTLIAAIELPLRSVPMPKGAAPQAGQNACAMWCLLNMYVERSSIGECM